MPDVVSRPVSRGVLHLALVAGLLASCAAPERKPAATPDTATVVAPQAPGPLAGTSWKLVELQSMDDAQGTTRPSDPSRFTMRLNADGSVQLLLDCNRATGTWTATPSADPSNGQFTFGPLAATSAACPPPAIGERIAAQAQHIRGYMLKDGRLGLSLMADGGIWLWEPDTDVAFEATPDPAIEAAILKAFPDYTTAAVHAEGGVGAAHYAYSRVDLNGDGKDEVFVYPMGSIFCGTGGCNLLVLTPGANGYDVVANLPTSRPPVVVLAEMHHGWHDFARLQSGGGAPASYGRVAFDGTRYATAGKLPADTPPAGRQVLAGDLTFANGAPLAPAQ